MAEQSMQGKVALVTGATNGIGRVAAMALAKRGAEVVIVGRDPARTASALAWIKEQSGSERVTALLGDLSRQGEVRRVAAEFRAHHAALHVLLNNAGALFHQRTENADGQEMTFALNHLGYFVLTAELRPLLEASAPARIVSVASEAHRGATLDFDDLNSARGYSRIKAYSRSKLCNILFTRELARRLAGTGVTANCIHPGVVATGFAAGTGLAGALVKLAQPFLLTPEKGADTLVWAATHPELEGQTGLYFAKRKIKTPSAAARDDAAAARLWDVTEALVSASPRAATA